MKIRWWIRTNPRCARLKGDSKELATVHFTSNANPQNKAHAATTCMSRQAGYLKSITGQNSCESRLDAPAYCGPYALAGDGPCALAGDESSSPLDSSSKSAAPPNSSRPTTRPRPWLPIFSRGRALMFATIPASAASGTISSCSDWLRFASSPVGIKATAPDCLPCRLR